MHLFSGKCDAFNALFTQKKKTGAFKHRECNSQALVMISNIYKTEEGEKFPFACFSVKEEE